MGYIGCGDVGFAMAAAKMISFDGEMFLAAHGSTFGEIPGWAARDMTLSRIAVAFS